MSGRAGARQRSVLEQENAFLREQVKRLRGMGTPGAVIDALRKVETIATQAQARCMAEAEFWGELLTWATGLREEEEDEWGPLAPGDGREQ